MKGPRQERTKEEVDSIKRAIEATTPLQDLQQQSALVDMRSQINNALAKAAIAQRRAKRAKEEAERAAKALQ